MLERIKSFIYHGVLAKLALIAAVVVRQVVIQVYDEVQVTYFPKTYEISGIASTTTVVRGAVVATGAFVEAQKGLILGDKPIPLMMNHSNNIQHIIGKVTALDLRFGKTLFKAEIIANKANRAVIQKIKDGVLTDVSIGFMVKDMEVAADKRTAIITKIQLFEISLVFAGADPHARITDIKEK